MKITDFDKSVLTLFILVAIEILWSGIYAISGTWQQRSFLLTCQVIPLLVALPGLWKFKYWAWLVVVIVAGYNLSGLFSVIPNWSTHLEFYRKANENLIKGSYMLIINHVINLTILVLLIVERDYFNE